MATTLVKSLGLKDIQKLYNWFADYFGEKVDEEYVQKPECYSFITIFKDAKWEVEPSSEFTSTTLYRITMTFQNDSDAVFFKLTNE
jgi:hypothetical protein